VREGLGRWLVIGESGDMWILCGFEVWWWVRVDFGTWVRRLLWDLSAR